MTNLPPEVRQACVLLQKVGPPRGSKERIYWRVTNRPRRHGAFAARLTILAVGLCVSATAFGVGFNWLAPHNRTEPAATAVPLQLPPSLQVPRNHQNRQASQVAATTTASSERAVVELDATCSRKNRDMPVAGAEIKPNSDSSRKAVTSLLSIEAKSPQPDPTAVESELSQQVADYRQAVAQLRGNPEAALLKLRAHRRKWERSPIAHEVDLRIIEALVSLGRRDEWLDAARKFLQRYPDSARAAEVRRLAESG